MSPKRTRGKTMIDEKIQQSHLPIGFIAQSLGVPVTTLFTYRTGRQVPPYEFLVRLANFLTERGVQCTADDLRDPTREYRGPGQPRKTPKVSEPTPLIAAGAPPEFEYLGEYAKIEVWRYMAAGALTDEVLELEDQKLEVPPEFEGDIALRIRGDSMSEDGIHDGDRILVRPGTHAKDGDRVIAYFPGRGTTCKILRIKGRKRWLQAASTKHKDIPIRASDQVEIKWIVLPHVVKDLSRKGGRR